MVLDLKKMLFVRTLPYRKGKVNKKPLRFVLNRKGEDMHHCNGKSDYHSKYGPPIISKECAPISPDRIVYLWAYYVCA